MNRRTIMSMVDPMTKPILAPQAENFPQWYQDVIQLAALAENGPARGTMIIKPWGYAIWERIQAELDARIKATGHVNAYFPLFIPMSYLQREAAHVEGFNPELAVVTHGGGSELGEPLAVRPTSETIIGDAMSRWIQSHRDLPLLLNQWANVVRWELRPRLFLRTSEFLWQEGHTAHATWDEAQSETLRMLDVYDDLMRNVLGISPICGRKTTAERFAGAQSTFTLEALMRDGKALQMGTSHNLGQNFAEAFDISYTNSSGEINLCWMTSWGVSTRVIGALIMVHGDDRGLRLPPSIAPEQVVVLAVRSEATEACRKLESELSALAVRVKLDTDTHTGFGRRVTDWELKGVPIRVEIGPHDIDAGQITYVRRDTGEKANVPSAGAAAYLAGLLNEIQRSLLDQALARQEASTHDVSSVDDVDGPGFFRLPWSAVGEEGERALNAAGYSVRCLVRSDGSVPTDDADIDTSIAYAAKAY